jgi:protein-tyrosine phosphatase
MTMTLLFTQCLQRDFVAPLGPHEALPNALHVGAAEARRLLGVEPEIGPLAQLIRWARTEASEAELKLIHIRDWHDARAPKQQPHLEHFGSHCLAGSEGAELILDIGSEVEARANEFFVASTTLNDFEETDLAELIERCRSESLDGRLRAGIIGVWTEAKVSFLCYELLTRCGIEELGTCSALTASASRDQHFIGLRQLEKVLGVKVWDSVGEFAAWLDPSAPSLSSRESAPSSLPNLSWSGAPLALSLPQRQLIGALYRDSAEIELQALSGGYSGALVLSARGRDALGHQQAPSVAKLGPRALIGAERRAFEQVEAILGNAAPSLRASCELGELGGLKYAYASMGAGGVKTLKSLFDEDAPQQVIEAVIERVFAELLAPFHRAAVYDRLPLLEYYGFEPRYAPSVRARVEALMSGRGGDPKLDFEGGRRASNVADFYADDLPVLRRAPGESHYKALVHGDLNGANIILDDRDNVWLIDFFHAHRGHALKDLAKLENDLLFIFTPLADDAASQEAYALTDTLSEVRDLRADLPPCPRALQRPALRRAWDTLRLLRAHGARLCREDRDPQQLRIALLRYAVHALSFVESSERQKRWALYSAGRLAEGIRRAAEGQGELRVDWLEPTALPTSGRLGLTICPGRQDRGRTLARDLESLLGAGARRLVCLLPEDELEWAGVPALLAAAESRGLATSRLPIPDQRAPELGRTRALCCELRAALEAGEDVVIHCLGGLGRSGTIAACLLIDFGATPTAAIAACRAARGPRAIESPAQERFVERYRR